MNKEKIATGVVHEVPADMQKVLSTDANLLAKWNSLTPLARNEWICWTISVKKSESRKNHIERMSIELKEGKRRPCCWYGCIHRTDKAVSPSIQNLIINKKRKFEQK